MCVKHLAVMKNDVGRRWGYPALYEELEAGDKHLDWSQILPGLFMVCCHSTKS